MKWRNVKSYSRAKKWLEQNFPLEFIPVWTKSGKSEMDTVISLQVATWLLTNAKNSAVRAAVHNVFIGDATLLDRDTDDGCPYYDSTGNYLGRGEIRYATYRPDCSPDVDYGFAVIQEITPLEDGWSDSDGYNAVAIALKQLK